MEMGGPPLYGGSAADGGSCAPRRCVGTCGSCHEHGQEPKGGMQRSRCGLEGKPAGFRAEKELNPAVVL